MIAKIKRVFASWRAWRWLAIWERRQRSAEQAKARHLMWWRRAVPPKPTTEAEPWA